MNKIQYWLDYKDRSQAWLARKIKKSNSTVNLWCKQKNQPNVNDLLAIYEVFNISIYELIENNRPDRCEIKMVTDEEK